MEALIITGMHRSGTSLVANFLRHCGLYLGDNLLSGDLGNPLGYYEDNDVVEFHRRILERIGQDTFVTDPSLLPIGVSDRERRKGVDFIHSRKLNLCTWGWKDPRTALFLDFWDSVFSDAGITVSFLFLYRDPLVVVDSLLRRGLDPQILDNPAVGFRSWSVYNLAILRFAEAQPGRCMLRDISSVIETPEQLVSDLVDRFSIRLRYQPFDDIFAPQALKRTISWRSTWLKVCHQRSYRDSNRLYQRLRSIGEEKCPRQNPVELRQL